MIEIFILSLIQGISEFLPISSSSHLIIFSEFTQFDKQSLTIDVSLHIGSFLAVTVYFYKDIINFFYNKDLFFKVFLTSLPVMFMGYLLVKYNLIEELRNIKVIGWTTLIFGILLFVSDKFKLEKSIANNFNYKSAIFIGLFQMLSLVPGVSRSGISITAARFLNFNRFDSAKLAFLISLPTLAAVSIFGINNLIKTNNLDFSLFNITSIFLSFTFSFITIKYFLEFIKRFNLIVFVIYRVLLGLILLFISYL